jgi:hypothetical protein
MSSELRVRGQWWLPSNPDRRYDGEVEFIEGVGVRLLLEAGSIGWGTRPGIVLGEADDGRKVTLYRLWFGNTWNLDEYRAEAAFVGLHFAALREVSFQNLDVSYPGLQSFWAGLGCEQRDSTFTLPSGMTMSLVEGTASAGGVPPRCVQLNAGTRAHFQEWRRAEMLLSQFLTLAMNRHAVPTDVRFGNGAATAVAYFTGMRAGPVDVQPAVGRSLIWSRNTRNLGEYVSNWCGRQFDLCVVYSLYASAMPLHFATVQSQFISLMQALEAYCRASRRTNAEYLKDGDVFEHVRKALTGTLDGICGLDSDFKEAVRTKLKYANEWSLRKRMKDLVMGYEACLQTEGTYIAVPVDRMVEVRNALTHPSPVAASTAPNPRELARLAYFAKLLVEMCLLREIGMGDADIARALRDEYAWLIV